MRIRFWLVLIVFVIAGAASASEVIDGELCEIRADQVIRDDVFVFCTTLLIEGEIRGNIFGAARTATITGTVTGSLYLAGGELTVSGEVGKDIHFAGVILTVQDGTEFGHESSGIVTANLSNTIDQGAAIPGSLLNLGYQLIINGDIGEHINFFGSALDIAGNVNGDVDATVGNSQTSGASSQIETLLIPFPFEIELIDPGLTVRRGANVNGTLQYRGANPGSIRGDVAELDYIQTGQQPLIGNTVQESARSLQIYLRGVIREASTLGFIGAIFMLILPKQMYAASRYIRFRPLSTLGVGMLTFILSFPIFLIIAVISILIVVILSLLPLDTVVIFGGVALALGNIGSASIFYFIAIYIARIIVALAIGRFIVRLMQGDYEASWRELYLSLAVGILVLALGNSIPTIGFVVNAMALFIGLGSLLTLAQRSLKQIFDNNAARHSSGYRAVQTVPALPEPTFEPVENTPILEDANPNPGMDDLPEGFNWWSGDED